MYHYSTSFAGMRDVAKGYWLHALTVGFFGVMSWMQGYVARTMAAIESLLVLINLIQ